MLGEPTASPYDCTRKFHLKDGGVMQRVVRIIALALGALCAVACYAQSKVNIFVASGPTSGVYYPLGGGLADVLTKYVPNLNATAGTTDGSMANLLLMGQGKADVAFS